MTAHPVRCSGCHRAFGWSSHVRPTVAKVYCSTYCLEQPDLTPQHRRHAEWEILFRHGGRTPVQIAKGYGAAHPLVYRVLGSLGIRFNSVAKHAA